MIVGRLLEQIIISYTYWELYLSFDGEDFFDATFYHFYVAREFKTDLTDARCDMRLTTTIITLRAPSEYYRTTSSSTR